MLDVIQKVATRDDRARAVIFFVYFARFEYALKRAGFYTNSDDAQPNWDGFAKEHSAQVLADTATDFVEAVAYFKSFPPKKQIVTDEGLEWADDKFSGAFDLARLLVLVRRVRNNLFHGGKFQSGIAEEISRDTKLLDSSLAVLEACRRAEHKVSYHFHEGLLGQP